MLNTLLEICMLMVACAVLATMNKVRSRRWSGTARPQTKDIHRLNMLSDAVVSAVLGALGTDVHRQHLILFSCCRDVHVLHRLNSVCA